MADGARRLVLYAWPTADDCQPVRWHRTAEPRPTLKDMNPREPISRPQSDPIVAAAVEMREFREALDHGELFIAKESIAWQVEASGAVARMDIGGSPQDVGAFITVNFGSRTQAASYSLIWRRQRLFGVDLAGPSHADLRGRMIPTPHRQWLGGAGVVLTEPLDRQALGLVTLEDVWRYFIDWCGLHSGLTWVDPPPVQLGAMGMRSTMKRRRKR